MKQLSLFLFLGTTFLLINWPTSLSAQTIYIDQNASGIKDGSSWTNAFVDLQAAIMAAPAGAELWIAKGIYQPGERTKSFQIDKKLHLYGGFNGNETALADRNLTDNQTFLSGDNLGDDSADDLSSNRIDNSYHVVVLQAGSTDGSLNNLFIKGGTGDTEGEQEDPRRYGGGVHCLANKFEFKACVFEGNTAWQGGAIDIFAETTEEIQLKDCLFQNNQAEYGGPSVQQNLALSYE